ncbi:MAG: hypothetical protein LBL17_02590 [Coxiellaceae bacterium]|jgi:predicted Rossmann fold nucleotide-binding protein DprA/Smf involved in DNA uptake|nr:hypothetical protein [Coxiellaceae bacterium]
MDILEELPNFKHVLPRSSESFTGAKEKNKLDCQHEKLLDCMGFEVVTLDILASRTNLSVSQVSVMSLELELCGLVKAV